MSPCAILDGAKKVFYISKALKLGGNMQPMAEPVPHPATIGWYNGV